MLKATETEFFIPLGIPRVTRQIISFMLHISVMTSFTNWYLYWWVSWNISQLISENSASVFNYWDDFSKCRNFYKWTKYKTTKSVKDVADKEFNSLAYWIYLHYQQGILMEYFSLLFPFSMNEYLAVSSFSWNYVHCTHRRFCWFEEMIRNWCSEVREKVCIDTQ